MYISWENSNWKELYDRSLIISRNWPHHWTIMRNAVWGGCMIGFERKLLLEIKPLVLNKGVFNTQFRARLSNTDEQKERAQCCSASSGYSDANFEHTVSEGKKENRSKVQVRQRYSPTYGRKQKERRLEGENPSQFGTNPKVSSLVLSFLNSWSFC